HAVGLSHRGLRLREVEDTEIHRHRVERCVGEGKRLGVALDERPPRTAGTGALEHGGSDVEADRIGAARYGGLGDVSRTTGDVQEPGPLADAGRVEQGLEEQERVVPGALVERRGPVPSVALELPERVACAWLRHSTAPAPAPARLPGARSS